MRSLKEQDDCQSYREKSQLGSIELFEKILVKEEFNKMRALWQCREDPQDYLAKIRGHTSI